MRERTVGLLLIFGTAVITGIFFGARNSAIRDQRGAHRTAGSSSKPEPEPEIPPPRAASGEEIRATITRLGRDLRSAAGDPKNAWALAHGVLAFGKDFEANNGRPAIDVMASFAEEHALDGKKLWLFPESKDGAPVEPHRFLIVKTLLDVGVPLDRVFVTSSGEKVPLARLVADMRQAAALPVADADYHQAPWLVSALVLDRALEPKVAESAPGPKLGELEKLVLARLEADQRVVASYGGPIDRAFDEGSALFLAKRDKTGIYGESCGGLHLVQAVLSAVAAVGDDADRRRVKKQLGTLLYRYELERTAYASLLARHPEQGLLIRTQQLKFFGHLLETLTLARQLGFVDPASEGGKKIESVIGTSAGDVASVAKELDEGGVYARLEEIRKKRQQTALDLVGDGCHALRALARMRGEAGVLPARDE